MDAAKPSLELVRSLTDEHVLRALMRHRRLTRAELAVEIGISKPTAGESVRRLTERGLVVDTGERTPGGRGRGRVGSLLRAGRRRSGPRWRSASPRKASWPSASTCTATPWPARSDRSTARPDPDQVAAALRGRGRARSAPPPAGRPRWPWSAPPTRSTAPPAGCVQLPDAPFLVGELDPVDVLAPYVDGPVIVDNDVNWAARAERDHSGRGSSATSPTSTSARASAARSSATARSAAARTGLAGEIAHLFTIGPGGRAVQFIEVFGELGLRRNGSTAIDIERLLQSPATTWEAIGTAVAGVIAAVIALADPQEVVLGGSWGPALLADIRAATARMPRHVPVRSAQLIDEPVLAGVRAEAINRLRALITASG